MIRILTTEPVYDFGRELFCRYCNIVITDNSIVYQLGVGGLPLEGDLQSILEARQDELLEIAVSKDSPKTNEQVRHLLYSVAWSNEAFQAAVIENMAENVGGEMPKFAEILALFEAINEEWPVQGEGKK